MLKEAEEREEESIFFSFLVLKDYFARKSSSTDIGILEVDSSFVFIEIARISIMEGSIIHFALIG
jgi:hypothetical protein